MYNQGEIVYIFLREENDLLFYFLEWVAEDSVHTKKKDKLNS